MKRASVRIPSGILLPDINRIFVSTQDGQSMLLDAMTGEPLVQMTLPMEPIEATDNWVVAARPPSERDLGEVALMHVEADQVEILWSVPLLDAPTHEQVVVSLDRVELNAKILSDEVVVQVRIHSRYRGGALPSRKVLAAATGERVISVHLRREDGEVLELVRDADDSESSTGPEPNAALRPGRTPNAWEAPTGVPGKEQMSVVLDEGTEAAALVGDEVIYQVTELDEASNSRRRYLRSAKLDMAEPKWSRLLDELAMAPPPPRRE